MAIVKHRVNVDPYFKKIADYYWEERPIEVTHVTIWEWLERDYGAVKLGSRKGNTWLCFPDQEHLVMFILRWS